MFYIHFFLSFIFSSLLNDVKKIVNFNSKIKKLLRIISSPPLLKDYFYLINLIYLTDTYMLIENKSIISFKRIKFYEWKNYHDIKIKLQYN